MPYEPHQLTSIGSIPKPTALSRVPRIGLKTEMAVTETAQFMAELRKRHGLDYGEVAAVLGRVQNFYHAREADEDPFHDVVSSVVDEPQQPDLSNTGHDDTVERIPPPSEAPETWKARDLNRRENAATFIRRVYGPWLGRGLERKDLAVLDYELYKALSVWVSRHPDDPIVALLPPQKERLDDLIEHLSKDYPLDLLRRLGHAIDGRLRRKGTL